MPVSWAEQHCLLYTLPGSYYWIACQSINGGKGVANSRSLPALRFHTWSLSSEHIFYQWTFMQNEERSIGHSKQKCVYVHVSYSERFPRYSYFTVQYTVQTSDTPCLHTRCKVHWRWRRNFRKYIILGKLYQLCHLNSKYRY
jgi:hypothetical protein